MDPSLAALREREFGLDAFVAAVSALLRSAPAPADGRVSEHPDARTLRYYQTTGLLDRPLRYDGRRAVYGYRHLLQAVAIKLLQGQGLSLGQIQRALAGATLVELEAAVAPALQALARRFADAGRPSSGPSVSALEARPTKFLEERAIDQPVAAYHLELNLSELPEEDQTRAQPLIAEQVAPGVTVLIDPTKSGDPKSLLKKIRELLEEDAGGES
jgi:DNA-binding transcriptional MerR regulator